VPHSDKHTSFLHGGINCRSKKFYVKALELFGCVRRFSFGLAAIEGREGWGCHGRKGGGGCSFYLATKSAKRDFLKGKPVWGKFRVDTLRRHDLSGPFATKNALISFWVYLGAWIHRDGMDS